MGGHSGVAVGLQLGLQLGYNWVGVMAGLQLLSLGACRTVSGSNSPALGGQIDTMPSSISMSSIVRDLHVDGGSGVVEAMFWRHGFTIVDI